MKKQTAGIYLISVFVIVCGIVLAPTEHPTRWFDEKQTVTAYSALLLYTCALVSAFNFLVCRNLSHLDRDRRSLQSLWALAIPGFAFLMADEFFVMHEGIGRFFAYRVLHLTVSSFADHLDGLVIVGYGVGGLATLLYYSQELKQIRRFFSFMTIGAIFAGLSVALDLRAESLWSTYVEDGAKVLANASFLLACLSSLTRDFHEIRSLLSFARTARFRQSLGFKDKTDDMASSPSARGDHSNHCDDRYSEPAAFAAGCQ